MCLTQLIHYFNTAVLNCFAQNQKKILGSVAYIFFIMIQHISELFSAQSKPMRLVALHFTIKS